MKYDLILLLVVATSALAVAASGAQGKGSEACTVFGQVLQEPGGQPVRKVDIQLVGAGSEQAVGYQTSSDTDGKFNLSGIAPGRYRLIVRREGFLPRKYAERLTGHELSLTAGQKLDQLLIKMQPTAVIGGRVTDQDGDPLPGAAIHAIPDSNESHVPGFGTTALANDLGEYRIGNLAPGKYLILAVPRAEYQLPVSQERSNPGQNQDRPYPTYYPGTFDRTQAIALELRPGDQASADVSILTGPAFSVRGMLSGTRFGHSGERVAFVSADVGFLPFRFDTAQIKEDGTFEIRDVLPGHYSAQLVSVNDTGQVQMSPVGDVLVRDADVEHLQLSEITPSTVAGTLRVEGQSGFRTAKYYVTLVSSKEKGTIGLPSRSAVGKDGSFELSNVPPGTYQALVWAESTKNLDLFVKSVSVAGRDATDEEIVIRSGPYRIDIVASTQCAQVQGSVTGENGQPSPEAAIVAVPQGALSKRGDSYRIATSDQRGNFQITGLIPGKYSIVAAQDLEDDYRDPEFLQKYSAVKQMVDLSQGERKSISLKLQSPAEN